MVARPHPRTVGALVFTLLMVLSPIGSVAAISAPAGPAVASAGSSPTAGATTAPQAPTGATGAPDDAASGPAAAEAPQAAANGSFTTNDADPAKLSPAVEHAVATAVDESNGSDDAPELVPVIVVLDEQPEDHFNLGTMAGPEARQQLKQFAKDRQAPLLSFLDDQGATDVRSFWIRNLIAVEATPETVLDLTRSSRVERVLYDQRVSVLTNGTSPAVERLLDRLDDHGNLSARPQGFDRVSTGNRVWSTEYIGADDVQERGITGVGVNVSVVDTGIDSDHPALNGTVSEWRDFAGNCSSPCDPMGHGTHVAGTIAGQPDAAIAVGTAPGANLFGARVLGAEGGGRLSDVLAGFEWSANQSADVISASLGVSPLTDTTSLSVDGVGPGNTSSTTFLVNQSAANFSAADDLSVSVEGFKPAYAFVAVEPIEVNGEPLDAQNQTRVMRNLTVTLEDPSGNRSLERVEADWVFQSGGVPDSIGLWKFKPPTSRTIPAGNWTITVTNGHNETISYAVSTLTAYPTNGSDEMARFVNNLATSQDVIPVIAAGNSGFLLGNRSLGSPGAAEEAITVGATGYRTNDVATFSSRGPVGYSNETRPGVDLIAPGTDVVSSVPLHYWGTDDYADAYAIFDGTSMATPHVSGVVALVLDAAGGPAAMTRAEVRSRLRSTAQPVPLGANAVGAGALDAWAAVNATVDLGARTPRSERGVHELFAGFAGSGDDFVDVNLEPVADPAGDAGGAPDIRAVSGSVVDNFELVTYNRTPPNATFDLYLDVDRNDSTGDPAQRGAEFRVTLERTFTPDTGVYTLAITEYEYDNGSYVPTTNVSTGPPDDVQGDFIEFQNLYFANQADTDPFEWHVVASAPSTANTDVAPDAGQRASPMRQNLTAQAIAWNATAGGPDVNATVEMTLYNDSTDQVVANATVTTDAAGYARATFPVAALDEYPYDDYEIVIEDQYGNRIDFHDFQFRNSCLEGCLVDTSAEGGGGSTGDIGNVTVLDRYYEAPSNTTVEVNVPLYTHQNDTLTPYNGTASLRLLGDEFHDFDNLTVSDGVLRVTVDLNATTFDDDGYSWGDLYVALEPDFENSTSTTRSDAGSIETVGAFASVETRLAPVTGVTPPGRPSNVSFQNLLFVEGDTSPSPANVSVEHTTIWITDRQVAGLFDALPEATVEKLQALRYKSTTPGAPTTELSPRDEQLIRQAVRNLSTPAGTSVTIKTGRARPDQRGTGVFTVTPPEDARYGFTFAEPNASAVNASYGFSNTALTFVDGRLADFRRQPTQPDETNRYELVVDGFWGWHREGDYVVPNDTITTYVGLYDHEADEWVDGATVRLYSTTENVTSVTTSGSGPRQVDLPAPDYHWPTTHFNQREQSVVAIAEGYNTADGHATATQEFFFGPVVNLEQLEPPEHDVVAAPELSYDNGTLHATLHYLNETTFEPATATRTLVLVSTPDVFFGIQRDLAVGFLDPPSNVSSTSTEFDEPVPPAERRVYEAASQTGETEPFTFWTDQAFAGGLRAVVDGPDQLSSGQSATVTITIVDRTGTPVPDATVVWEYFEGASPFGGDGGASESGLATTASGPRLTQDHESQLRQLAGGTGVATTDANGEVTFTVSAPELERESDQPFDLGYRVGVATDAVSYPFVGFGEVDVTATQPVTHNGTLFENASALTAATGQGPPAAGDQLLAREVGGSIVAANITTDAGDFAFQVQNGTTYDLEYLQFDESKDVFTIGERDGSVDLWPVDRVEAAGNHSFGNRTLPEGYPVNVTVLDSNGVPVEGAQVAFQLVNDATGADLLTPWVGTRADGMMYPLNNSLPGLELHGNVTVGVRPPAESDRYVDETHVRHLDVTGPRNLTFTLQLAGTGNLTATPQPAYANYTAVTLELSNVTPESLTDEIAGYEWDFGDGETVTTAAGNNSTTHVYATPGNHTATVTAVDDAGTVLVSATTTVNVTRGDVSLSASPQPAYANATAVNFSVWNVTPGTLEDNVTSFRLAFGDGETGTTNGTDTIHTYTQPGQYNATVLALDGQGEVLAVGTTTVNVTRAEGDLIAQPDSGYANYTRINLTLTNVTQNVTPALYDWSFGDGHGAFTNGSDNDSSHVYERPGTYNATVVAMNEFEQPLFTANATVTISRAGATLISEPNETLVGTPVNFTLVNGTRNVTPALYDWSFGDGEGDFTSHPNNTTAHAFEEPGTYQANVTALNELEQPLYTASTNLSILGPDLSIAVAPPTHEQRLQDGVLVNVTVTNERAVAIEDVPIRLTATGDYWNTRDEQTVRNFTVDVGADSSRTVQLDLTQWVRDNVTPRYYSMGRLSLLAQVDPEGVLNEADETNNRDVDRTVATFVDLETSTYTYYRTLTDDPHDVRVWIENDGSAAMSENATVLVEYGDGTTERREIGALGHQWHNDSVSLRLSHTYTQPGQYDVNATVLGDEPPYTADNRSSDTVEVAEFQFDLRYIRAPWSVENQSQFRIYAVYRTNAPVDVNLTLGLPDDGLELANDVDQNLTQQRTDSNGYQTVAWTLNATEADVNRHAITVDATARGNNSVQNDSETDSVRVFVPKVQVSDQAVIRINDSDAADVTNGVETAADGEPVRGNTTLTVRNETTFDHEVTVVLQAGPEGRTLQGLQYLFGYPYGCVEQTTSPMLAALSTDQYYRHENRTPGPNYDRDDVNKSIAIGMERLATGDNAQHENGSWSMWGNTPRGDIFYAMYAYFGTTSVRNDPVQAQNTQTTFSSLTTDTQSVSSSLDAIDFNETVLWIEGQQEADGAIDEGRGYFLENDAAMTGFALLTLGQAEEGGFNGTADAAAADIRRKGTAYLVSQQADSGAWGGHTKTTAIVLWGLVSARDSGDLQNETLREAVNASIENATDWLLDEQQADGGFTYSRHPYWSNDQRRSSATAWALLALNRTGLPADNESIRQGVVYLVQVYNDEGSWGGTESTGLAIRALNELGQGVSTVDRTVTVEIGDDDGTITKEVELNATQDIVRLSLNESELARLQNGSMTKPVNVTSTGDGVAVVAVRNDQVVNRNEYEATQRAQGLIQTAALDGGLSVLANGDDSNGEFSTSLSVPSDFAAGENQTVSVTVTNHNQTADLLNPIIEIPLTSAFNASEPLAATTVVNGTTETRRIEVMNSSLTDGEAIYVYGRAVPAGESRTYEINVTVPTPGDVTVVADTRPLYNESLNVNTSGTFAAQGVGTVNVDVVHANGTPASGATIEIGGTDTAASAVSRELGAGNYTITASTGSTTFPAIDVELDAFDVENVTYVVPPDDLTSPAVVLRTAPGVTVPGGTVSRAELTAPNATTEEVAELTFNVTTQPGQNTTVVVAVNESGERAFRDGQTRTVDVSSAGPTATVLGDDVGQAGNATTLRLRGDGELAVTVTYTGYKLGDATQNGAVDEADARDIASDLATARTPTAYADVNGDGEVTAVDAMLIAQHDAGNRDDEYGVTP